MKDISVAASKNTFLGKKKSNKVKEITLGKGKTKKAKTISEEQDILNILRSSSININNYTDVNTALSGKNKSISDIDKANFFVQILKYNYNISKIHISDILGGKKLNTILFAGDITKYPMSCFSNDKLFWIAFIRLKFNDFTKIASYIDLSNLEIDIATLAVKFEKDYKQGYIQDFDKQLSFIGFTEFNISSEEAAKLLDTANPDKKEDKEAIEKACKWGFKWGHSAYFSYNGVEYFAFSLNNDIILIHNKSYTADQVAKAVKNTKIISSSDFKKTKGELEIKKAPGEGDRGGIYISQTLKLTDFAPFMVSLNQNMNTEILFKLNIDVAAYNEHLLTEHNSLIGKETEHKKVGDFFSGTALDDKDIGIIYSMLLILYITQYKDAKEIKDVDFKKNLEKFLEEYPKQKENLSRARYMFDHSFNIIEKFYDAFKSKINFEPIKSIYNILIKTIVEIEEFYSSFDFKTLTKFLDEYNLDKMFRKLVAALDNRKWIHDLINRIYKVTKMFNTLEDPTEIIRNVRETGVLCYRIFYNPKEKDSLDLVWKLRSPSSFLGNVFDSIDSKFDISSAKMLGKAMEKYVEAAEAEKKAVTSLLKVIDAPKTEDEDKIKGVLAGLAEVLINYTDLSPAFVYEDPKKKEGYNELFQEWLKTILPSLTSDQLKQLYVYNLADNGKIELNPFAVYSVMTNVLTLRGLFDKYVEENETKKKDLIAKIRLAKKELDEEEKKVEELKPEVKPVDEETEISSTLRKKYHSKEGLASAIGKVNKYILKLENQKKLGLKTLTEEQLKKVNREMLKMLRNTAGIADEVIIDFLMDISPTLKKSEISMQTMIDALQKHYDLIAKTSKGYEGNKKDLAESGIVDVPEGVKIPVF